MTSTENVGIMSVYSYFRTCPHFKTALQTAHAIASKINGDVKLQAEFNYKFNSLKESID